jgi:hypothetical protein
MKYYFIYKETDLMGKETGKVITHQFETSTLSEILENFEYFLRGASFQFDGSVDIVPPEQFTQSEEEHSEYFYDFDRNRPQQMPLDFRV